MRQIRASNRGSRTLSCECFDQDMRTFLILSVTPSSECANASAKLIDIILGERSINRILRRASNESLPGAGATELFFLETRVIARDALCEHVIPISRFQHVQRLLLSRLLIEGA
jgi:hypothetical protein